MDWKTLQARLKDRLWRIENLYYIKDKNTAKAVLFKPNWAQIQLLLNPHNRELVPKARQLGITTLSCIEGLDLALWGEEGMNVEVICHRLPDARRMMGEKIKFAYDRIPPDIRPKLVKSTDEWLIFEHGSQIRCSTTARSGTIHFLHVSEMGRIDVLNPLHAEEILNGSEEAVPLDGRVRWESTVEAAHGWFASRVLTAQARDAAGGGLTRLDWKLHFFPWHGHSEYRLNEEEALIVKPSGELIEYFRRLEGERGIVLDACQRAWYCKKLESRLQGLQKDDDDLGDVSWAGMKKQYPSFLDEAFEQPVAGSWYAEQFACIDKEERITDVPHDGRRQVETWWDVGTGDSTAIWFVQRYPTKIHVIDFYQEADKGCEYFCHLVRRFGTEKGYTYSHHFGPHDLWQRHFAANGEATAAVAERLGILFEPVQDLSIIDGINATRAMLRRCWFDKTRCAAGIQALRGYRKKRDEEKNLWTDKPVHDKCSHPADAFRMGGVAFDMGDGDWGGGTVEAAIPTAAWS